jgi:hypothetical protein
MGREDEKRWKRGWEEMEERMGRDVGKGDGNRSDLGEKNGRMGRMEVMMGLTLC